jgi:hypothetical protein
VGEPCADLCETLTNVMDIFAEISETHADVGERF